MTAAVPALALVAMGMGVAAVGSTLTLASAANAGPLAPLLAPALESLAVATVIGLGGIQVLGGVALLAAGWS